MVLVRMNSRPHPLTEQEDATYRVKTALTAEAAIKRAIRMFVTLTADPRA